MSYCDKLRRFAAVAAALGFATTRAFAAWGPNGATIKSTTASIPLVTACSDGSDGSFVAWQELTGSGVGVLLVQHVLSTGDVDPTWPAAGAVASGTIAGRSDLGATADGLGGLYLWWRQISPSTQFVNHLSSSGQEVPGWPGGGVAVGSVSPIEPASAIADGEHGLYIGWANHLSGGLPRPDVVHIAPDGTYLASVDIATPSGVGHAWNVELALAPDGGVFAIWGTSSEDTTQTPSDLRIRRLNADGTNAAGWPSEGLQLGPFSYCIPALSLDRRGGVFLLALLSGGNGPDLVRLTGDGQRSPDWPASVQPAFFGGGCLESFGGPDYVTPDGQDGVFAGYGDFPYSDSPPYYNMTRFQATGAIDWSASTAGELVGHPETVVKGDGGVFLATFSPKGPYQYADPDAFLSLKQTHPGPGWTDFGEDHPDPVVTWYGDIGLAPAPDGGCVFFWSQVRERFGLFARRFSGTGEVTAVEPAQGTRVLRIRALRFVAGSGVIASFDLADARPARLELYDAAGRRIAGSDLSGAGVAADVLIPGTAWLPSGMYFVRLSAGARTVAGRVVVLK
jgi:hypothetical protein